MLVDSGSSVTLLNEVVWSKVNMKVKSSLLSRTVPGMGEQLNGVGEMDRNLQIGIHQVRHSVLEVTQILQQCLDFLEKQMDLRKRTLPVGTSCNCLLLSFGSKSYTCQVVMGEKIVIPGRLR